MKCEYYTRPLRNEQSLKVSKINQTVTTFTRINSFVKFAAWCIILVNAVRREIFNCWIQKRNQLSRYKLLLLYTRGSNLFLTILWRRWMFLWYVLLRRNHGNENLLNFDIAKSQNIYSFVILNQLI